MRRKAWDSGRQHGRGRRSAGRGSLLAATSAAVLAAASLLALSAASLLALTVAGAGAVSDDAQAPDASAWVTDGIVLSIAREGGRTFIGGNFNRVGRRTGSGVPFSANVASDDPNPGLGSFPQVAGGDVKAVVSDTKGGWYIGGDFTHVGGVARTRLAHIVPDGDSALKVDPNWAPSANKTVRALAYTSTGSANGVVYVGGAFDSLGSSSIRYLGAIDAASGNVVTTFNPGPDLPVNAIAVRTVTVKDPAALVIIGGEFAKIGTFTTDRGGAVWGVGATKDGTTSIAGTVAGDVPGAPVAVWNPAAGATVRALEVGVPTPDNVNKTMRFPVYLGGDMANGIKAHELRVHVAGAATPGKVESLAITWNPGLSCDAGVCTLSVRSLALTGDRLYVGGEFNKAATSVGGKALVTHAAAFAPINLAALALKRYDWAPSLSSRVHAVAAVADGVFLGGDFANSQGGLAAFSPSVSTAATNDATLRSWNPNPSGGATGTSAGIVTALATDGSRVYAGGSFTSLKAKLQTNMAAFDSAGNLIDGWNPAPNNTVRALAAVNGRLYAGGDFANIGGAARNRLAALNQSDGSLVEGWAANVDSAGLTTLPQVMTLASGDGGLYVGGSFTSVKGVGRKNAAAVGYANGDPTGWDPNADDNVYALAVSCGAVYAGGGFKNIGGQARDRIAALDPVSGAASDWNPGSNAAVYALARHGTSVYAGGRFSFIGMQTRQKLAALDATTGKATGWSPSVAGDSVRAVAVPPSGSAVYAGGTFTTLRADISRNNIAKIDRTTGVPTSWNPGADATVRTLLADGEALYAGGSFRTLGGMPAHTFGSFAHGAGGSTPIPCSGITSGGGGGGDEGSGSGDQTPIQISDKPAAPGAAPDLTVPVLTKVSVKPKRFRVVKPGTKAPKRKSRTPIGTRLRFTLSEDARVGVSITRKTRVKCSRAVRRKYPKRRCYRWVRVGTRPFTGKAGANSVRFDGRVGERWLTPGSYRARLAATDAAKNRSKPHRLTFTVLSR